MNAENSTLPSQIHFWSIY